MGHIDIAAVRMLLSCFHIISQLKVEHFLDLLPGLRIVDGGSHLHTVDGVAGHEVGRCDIYLFPLSLSENVDPGMLQESSHDGHHPDILGFSGDTGDQAVDAADHHFDLHSRLGSLDHLVHDHLVCQGIQLKSKISIPAVPGDLDLPFDPVQDLILQAFRGNEEMLRGLQHLAQRKGLEHSGRFRSDLLVCGHDTEIRIQPGRLLIIVTGTDLGDILYLVPHLPGDEAQLGMHLKTIQSVDHMAARSLQTTGPADVVLLIESRLKLHQNVHLLAVLRSLHQRLNHFTVLCQTVEGHLDGNYVRIICSLRQHVQEGTNALIRIRKELVPLKDLGKQRLGLVQLR